MLATQIEVSDGTLHIINVGIEFFEQADISVALDQSDPLVEGVDYTWSAATVITFQDTLSTPGGLVPNGIEVILRRSTKEDELYNIYDGGAPFSRTTLDENFKQLIYLSQEFAEGLGLDGLRNNLDMNGYRITELGDPIAEGDAVNRGYMEAQLGKVIRVPENIPVLPGVAGRASKLLGFNDVGNPVAVAPVSGSAADLAIMLASTTGAGMVGTPTGTVQDVLDRFGDPASPAYGAGMIARGGQVVPSIAALRLLLKTVPSKFAFVMGYYLSGDGGGGAYYLDEADVVSADNAGSIIVAADGGRWKLKWSGTLSVKQFGAKGDYDFDTFSGTDDTVALQDCANALQATGGVMYHPPGSYQVTAQVEIVQPGTSDFVRVSVAGAGSGASQIVSNGNITAYRFTGTAAEGIHSYQHIQGLRFRAVGGTFIGTAIRVDNFAYGEFNDVLAENFEYGVNGTDILSSLFVRCQFRGNNFGNNLSFADASRPNAIAYLACVFTANKTWAIVAGSPSVITMVGGSVEGNGTDVGIPDRGGILMIGAGTEGAVGMNASGVYFEGNGGRADFFCTSSGADGQVAHSFTGCTFNRLSNTQFVANNIRIDGDSKAALSVTGCGFKHFNSYVPDPGRKYIALNFADFSRIDFSEGGNFYASDSERPFVAGQQAGPRSVAAAFVRFDGGVGGATLSQGYNVGSVTRTGLGVYQVNYQRAMSIAQNVYALAANGTGFHFRSAEATTSVTVTFTDSAGTPVDALGCCVTVFGQLAG